MNVTLWFDFIFQLRFLCALKFRFILSSIKSVCNVREFAEKGTLSRFYRGYIITQWWHPSSWPTPGWTPHSPTSIREHIFLVSNSQATDKVILSDRFSIILKWLKPGEYPQWAGHKAPTSLSTGTCCWPLLSRSPGPPRSAEGSWPRCWRCRCGAAGSWPTWSRRGACPGSRRSRWTSGQSRQPRQSPAARWSWEASSGSILLSGSGPQDTVCTGIHLRG